MPHAGAEMISDHEIDFLQFKLVILGDGAVGKTSLSMRFTEDKFAKRWFSPCIAAGMVPKQQRCFACSYQQTIGVDFFLKQLILPGDKKVAVQVGQ